MTGMKRSLDEISQPPTSELSKTDRRRLAKQAKRERQGKGSGSSAVGRGNGAATHSGAGAIRNGKKGPKPKMTKEERRAKYTQKAYEARDKQNQAGPGANKTRCLGCRAWGHIVAKCPDAKENMGICFNCGSSKHALRVCQKAKQKDGSLPHATCFICRETGHISAHCKQNANGIYPRGGFCKGCGSKHHLSWDCPDNPVPDKKKMRQITAAMDESEHSDDKAGGASGADVAQTKPRDNANAKAGGRAGSAVDDAVGAPVVGESGSKQRRRQERPGVPSGKGGKQPPAPRVGGDDLEGDGYYEPDDVPELRVEDDGTEDVGAMASSRGAPGVGASKGTKKKSKVVVF